MNLAAGEKLETFSRQILLVKHLAQRLKIVCFQGKRALNNCINNTFFVYKQHIALFSSPDPKKQEHTAQSGKA